MTRALGFELGLALAVAAACGGSPSLPGADRPREVKVTRGKIAERVLLTGKLRAASAVDLIVPKTDVWQLTIRWMAEDGAKVAAGERVLEFDNSSFTNGLEEKRLQLLEAESTARAARDLAQIGLANKQFEVEQHRLALAKATLLAGVPADLLPQRTAQERQLDKSRAAVALARAERELAAERTTAALDAKVKQLELDKARRDIAAAERTIEQLVLRAPRDGVVLIEDHPWTGHRFQIGDTVQPGFTIVTMPDLGQPLKVAAELSDVDDGKLAVGARGTCTLDAYPRDPVPCTVEHVAPVAQAPSRESLRRAFAVELGLARSDAERMRPGMSVEVELVRPPVDAALVVPRAALVLPEQGVDDHARVVLAGGDARDVTITACDAQACAIAGGLAEGDVVEVVGP